MAASLIDKCLSTKELRVNCHSPYKGTASNSLRPALIAELAGTHLTVQKAIYGEGHYTCKLYKF